MNFLGHAFLSGSDPDVLYGNFIADAIKGKSYQKYPAAVQKGILLHRQIDDYTDHYTGFDSFKDTLYPIARKFTPVVMDIFIDHMLASHWRTYHKQTLVQYSAWFFKTIAQYKPHPQRINYFLPYMQEGNWLLRYRQEDGFQWAVVNVAKRIGFPIPMEPAVLHCIQRKDTFLPLFEEFIYNIKKHAQAQLLYRL